MSATTLQDPPKPASNLTSTLNLGTGNIDLAWTDNSGGTADGFRVVRNLDNFTTTTVVKVTETAGNVTTYSDTGPLAPNTVYYYEVIAFRKNAQGYSDAAPTNVACSLTRPAP